MRCWLCHTPLTKKNWSREHIIPKALGGRQTVSDFLCRHCNNSTGHKWDVSLIEASKPWDLIVSAGTLQDGGRLPNFDLSKGPNRHETVSGNETRTMYRGGGDSVTSFEDRQLNIQVNSPSGPHLRRILENIRLKYSIPQNKWDTEQAVSSRLREEPSENHSVQTVIGFDMPKITRAMVKSVLALACKIGVKQEEFQGILPYWREENSLFLGGFPEWDVLSPEETIDLRCVAVAGSRETGCLFGFTNLIGSLPWIMPLIVPYTGPAVCSTYAINAKTGEKVSIGPQMERPRAKAVAIQTAEHIVDDTLSSLVTLPGIGGILVSQTDHVSATTKQAMLHDMVPLLRAWFTINRTSFNQHLRWTFGLPLIGEDGQSY